MPRRNWTPEDQARLTRLLARGLTVADIHAARYPDVPLTTLYRYARTPPRRYAKPTTPGERAGPLRSTHPRVDEAMLYLYVRGVTAPAIARVLDLTRRVVTHRLASMDALAHRHAYQRSLLANCTDDLVAGGIDAADAATRLAAEHDIEADRRLGGSA